jgi:hypothetical protein
MPQLIFPDWFDERAESEAVDRGYLSHITVRADDGRTFPVTFICPVRLQQELATMSEHGRPWLAEIGMIVLPEVSRPAMESAVADLARRGFFDYFRPLNPGDQPWDV